MADNFSHLGVVGCEPKTLQCVGQSVVDGKNCLVYHVKMIHYARMIYNTPGIVFSKALMGDMREVYVKAR